MKEIANEERYRLVVLGSAKVGKTSLIRRFLYKEFPEKYKETIEDLHSRDFRIQVGFKIKQRSRKWEHSLYRTLS